jgi:hypothetical protein
LRPPPNRGAADPVSSTDAWSVRVETMDDLATLTELNLRFVDAFPKGAWELLEPILSPVALVPGWRDR